MLNFKVFSIFWRDYWTFFKVDCIVWVTVLNSNGKITEFWKMLWSYLSYKTLKLSSHMDANIFQDINWWHFSRLELDIFFCSWHFQENIFHMESVLNWFGKFSEFIWIPNMVWVMILNIAVFWNNFLWFKDWQWFGIISCIKFEVLNCV